MEGCLKKAIAELNFPTNNYYMFRSLISQLLQEDPQMRLDCDSILNHPFFDSI